MVLRKSKANATKYIDVIGIDLPFRLATIPIDVI